MKNRWVIIGGAAVILIFVWLGFLKGRQANANARPVKNISAQKLYEQAVNMKNNRDLLPAKEIYQKILTDAPDFERIDQVEKELGDLNLEIIVSNVEVPNKTVMHEVQSGDSIAKIAGKYGTTVDLIKISNHLKRDVIRVGQKLRVWQGNFSIFVDKSQNILILKDGDEVVKVYQVSTGESNSTPVGTFKIKDKLENPVWFNKGIALPPESPQNVLGSRWMGFDTMPGYGIHGTIEPQTIGQQVTAGCVRMHNEDVEQLYSIVPYGTSVTIAD